MKELYDEIERLKKAEKIGGGREENVHIWHRHIWA